MSKLSSIRTSAHLVYFFVLCGESKNMGKTYTCNYWWCTGVTFLSEFSDFPEI